MKGINFYKLLLLQIGFIISINYLFFKKIKLLLQFYIIKLNIYNDTLYYIITLDIKIYARCYKLQQILKRVK